MTPNSRSEKDKVFIGIPCYNRPGGLQNTIECMQAQSHRNWQALVSDNCSTDPRVQEIGQAAADADPRISYHRHEENLGAVANFRLLIDRADAPLFMWASDDDVWEPKYIETLTGLIKNSPGTELAFASLEAINNKGELYRNVAAFSRFSSGSDRLEDARRYLEEPEILGKANIIYGIYRTETLRAYIEQCWDAADFGGYAGDIVFMFGFLSRYQVLGTDELLFRKRAPTNDRNFQMGINPKAHFVPTGEYRNYLKRHLAVSPNEQTRRLVRSVFRRRFIERQFYRLAAKLGISGNSN